MTARAEASGSLEYLAWPETRKCSTFAWDQHGFWEASGDRDALDV